MKEIRLCNESNPFIKKLENRYHIFFYTIGVLHLNLEYSYLIFFLVN